jgi:hypothetical protein
VRKYRRSGQATGDSIIWHRKDARIQTRTVNVSYLMLFHSNIGFTNMPLCYVMYIACLVNVSPMGSEENRHM